MKKKLCSAPRWPPHCFRVFFIDHIIFLLREMFVIFPIEFLDDYDAAYTTIKIEGQKYFLLFDTGSSYHSSLKKEILEKLKKTPHGTIFWYDF